MVIDMQEPVALTFALRYLNSFAKATPLASQVFALHLWSTSTAGLTHCGANNALPAQLHNTDTDTSPCLHPCGRVP